MSDPGKPRILRDLAENPPFMAALIICTVFFSFCMWLALNHPVFYWVDAHIRLAYRNQILIGYWPPLLQILIFAAWKFGKSLLVIRGLLSLVAATALLSVYRLTSRLFESMTGLIAMVLLAINMMFVAMSTVPYPEILFVGLVLLALDLLDNPLSSRSVYLGALALNLACLTRYEGWLLAAILIAEAAMRSLQSKDWKRFIGRALQCSVAPLGWLIFVVSKPGGWIARLNAVAIFTSGRSITGQFISRFNAVDIRDFTANYFHMLNSQAGIGIVMLGIIGWLAALLFDKRRAPHLRILTFLIFDWLLIAFWSPWDLSNLRQVFIVEIFLVLYAAHGLRQLTLVCLKWLGIFAQKTGATRWQPWITGILTLSIAFSSIPTAVKFVADSSHEPGFYIPSQVGAWLNAHMAQNDGVLLLSDNPFRPYALAAYTDYPLDVILDDLFDKEYIQSHLISANRVLIVELYDSSSGLSETESALLNKLESGKISAQDFAVSTTHVWIAPSGEVSNFLSAK
jgi:hypothetical protein